MASENSNGSSDRFSREKLAGYDPQRMEQATVVIVGAGALAQSLVTNLALPGTGEIRIVDFDEFEPHNATRSVFYPTRSEQELWGTKKAVIVAQKGYRLMLADRPTMRYATTTIQALGLGAFSGATVVVSAADNTRARAYLSDVCRLLGLPLIEAGFDGPSIAMSCFPATNDPADPCYRCGNPILVGTFSCQRYAVEAEKAGVIPAIQPASAALAGLQAEAAIQAIHGRFPCGFKRTALNVRTGAAIQYTLAANPGCHGVHRRLTGDIVALSIAADQTLHDLVAAVEEELGIGAEIRLPEPFIVDATCTSCGEVVGVVAPEWSYDMASQCIDCGGPWETLGKPTEGYSPTKPEVITRHTDPQALTWSCHSAGLPPMAILEARADGSGDIQAFQLEGTLDDLYRTVRTA